MSSSTLDPTMDANDGSEKKPAERAANPILSLLKVVGSLRITVTLFAMSMILVFFGTVAQKNNGIWTVVDQYFWSFWVKIELQLLLQFGQIFFSVPTSWSTSLWVPFPAGKTIGFAMVINLVAAHILQLYSLINVTAKQAKKGKALSDVLAVLFKRVGIYVLHAGILLLFVGEYVTRECQVEQNMVITKGGSSTFTFDTHNYELSFIDNTNPTEEKITVIPARLLRDAVKAGTRISHPSVPVDVEVKAYYVNSKLTELPPHAPPPAENLATTGIGKQVIAEFVPEGAGTDTESKVDVPSAYVVLYPKGSNESLGTFMVTTHFTTKQTVTVDKVPYQVELRFKHYYKPYKLELTDFTFEEYLGTNKPKNYTSHVRLTDPETGEDRNISISMNNPLRYRGETFYQSGFQRETTTTTLQVVRNPGWMLPYVSCSLVALGMLLHFSIGLMTFVLNVSGNRRRVDSEQTVERGLIARSFGGVASVLFSSPWSSNSQDRPSSLAIALPWCIFAMTGLCVLAIATPGNIPSKFNLSEFGQLPAVKDGRTQPLDSVARVQLRMLTNSEEYTDPETDKNQPAIKWYLDTVSATPTDLGKAGQYKIFRIENDRVLELVQLKPRKGLRYSFDELRPHLQAIEEAGKKASARHEAERDVFDRKLLELGHKLQMFLSILFGQDTLILAPEGQLKWRKPGEARQQAIGVGRMALFQQMKQLNLPEDPKDFTPAQRELVGKMVDELEATVAKLDPGYMKWQQMLTTYHEGDHKAFNTALADFASHQQAAVSQAELKRVSFESYLNSTAFYYYCSFLYVVVALLCACGWVSMVFSPGLSNGFRQSAFLVLLLTFLLHTVTLLSRMYLMDRPMVFVTNLYSSAVFIGWSAVALCLIIERIFPISLGNTIAAVIGFSTSLIAHNLAASGDTLEMMQAVLDTNFWLATHVTTVTLGYSATYIAGFLGLTYIAIGFATPLLKQTVVVGRSENARPQEVGRVIGQILYGIVCLAVMLSFVGTVLGGIWADQSWGRFWGWDPKENGAVLIVIWNALILHARWCGLVKDRGIAILAIIGNMITTWSWFGTNQLGVGLHAYGFSNALATGCMITWCLHTFFVILGMIPRHYWMSNLAAAKSAPAA